ncbi:hypothetical protein RFI_23783 [Reticulomyxa filosa]|uniref:Uncharacterized protein n=1 Tax=Reticulomyxa filosa TaxID=46433 RepID=X6MKI3_RETFI|nr:hypothetical protein RFI_23783 [Reticulomyxa filosa]|eukprot:ETO13585.1 hypothetical protein RFI_23783 [Reticulomyxa filosa]
MKLGIELADVKKKKYALQSMEEGLLLATETSDETWQKFELKMTLDAKDRCGKWYEATVMDIKNIGEAVTKDHRIKPERDDVEKLKQCLGLFVKYKGWEEKWNDWIYVQKNTICHCKLSCDFPDHRLAVLKTQSRFKSSESQGGQGGYVCHYDNILLIHYFKFL